ncbi:hypothetical protein BH18ACT4_BH18ACT4_14240 [soil metagenome]
MAELEGLEGRDRRFALRLGVIALLALAVRVAYILMLERTDRFGGDAFYYHEQANLLADGRGFLEPYQLETTGRELPSAYHPPLYPLFLAFVSLLASPATLAHQLASAVIGAATVVVTGLLGRRVGGPTVGWVAAAVAAVYPGLWISDALVMSETPTAFLVAVTLLGAYRHLDRPTRASALLLGAACGLAALTRGETLLLVPLVVLPVCLRRSGAATLLPYGHAALAVGAVAVLLAPWVLRNLAVFERPVLVSTNDGTTLGSANCGATYGGDLLGFWNFGCLDFPAREDESVARDHWRDRGLSYARDHLGRLPVVAAARVGRVWSLYRPLQMVRFDTIEGRDTRVSKAALAGFYVMVPAAVTGSLALRRRAVPVFPLAAMFVLVTVTAAAFYGITRFRITAEVPLVVLAATGAVEATRRGRRRVRSRPRDGGPGPA